MSEQKIESVKVTVVGKNGLPVEELIPSEMLPEYKKSFGKGIPHMADFEKWKEKQLYNSSKADDKPVVYKIAPAIRTKIHNYLNTRPMDDLVDPVSGVKLENIILGMFEVVLRDEKGEPILDDNGKEQPVADPFYTEDGLKLLVKYLRERCPRIDSKPLLEDLMNNGIEKYEVVQKAEEQEG